MNFAYRPVVVLSAETGEPSLILRPEITIEVFGWRGTAQVRALVDTGTDNSIFPRTVAERLGVTLIPGRGPEVTTFGGQKLPTMFGDVERELKEGSEKIRWKSRVQFFDFPSPDEESVILGHAGFLDYFTATFDGLLAQLTLIPNEELPAS